MCQWLSWKLGATLFSRHKLSRLASTLFFYSRSDLWHVRRFISWFRVWTRLWMDFEFFRFSDSQLLVVVEFFWEQTFPFSSFFDAKEKVEGWSNDECFASSQQKSISDKKLKKKEPINIGAGKNIERGSLTEKEIKPFPEGPRKPSPSSQWRPLPCSGESLQWIMEFFQSSCSIWNGQL